MNTHFLNEKGMASSLWHIHFNPWFTGATGTPIPETQVSCPLANLTSDSARKHAFVMKSNSPKPRIRWHVSKETATSLDRYRHLSGNKSWEDFFKEIIQRMEHPATEKNSNDPDSDRLLFAIQALETRNDELADYLCRLVNLLSLALGVKENSPGQNPATRSAFSRFIEERT